MDDEGDEHRQRWEQRTVPAVPELAPTQAAPNVHAQRPSAQPEPHPSAQLPATASVFDPPRERFVEGAELGRGGMGRVVAAVDRALGRPVAIKHSLAHSPTDLARFEREVRITARLQHPGIVPILDVGRDEAGQPYYIMRKIDGEPLQVRVDRAPELRDRLTLVPSVLGAVDAVAYAHANAVVHRDIKPMNILLGAFGEALLIDWGIARVLDGSVDDLAAVEELAATMRWSTSEDEALTKLGLAYGTPGFMAPEQARGEAVDRRADVYALGATLYFVLSGRLPASGDPTAAIARAAEGKGPDFGRIPREVPVELVAITRKAMAADQVERYADASELAVDLRRFLAGQLVAAHAYTATERIARWLRRHRVAAGVATVAVLAIAIITAVSISRVIAERDRVVVAQQLAESRAEQLLIDRARAMIDLDPTSTLALLRRLPAGSSSWSTARELVRAAVAGGVERANTTHTRAITAIAVAPDGRIATSSFDATIYLHDARARSSRRIAAFQANELSWLDARTLVYVTVESAEVGLLDVETGATRVLPVAAAQVVVEGGRVVVRTPDGAVTAFDHAATATPITTSGALAIDARAGRLLVWGRDRIVVFEAGAQRTRSVANPAQVFAARLSPSGDRVAISTAGAILEWSLDDERPPRRWPRTTEHLNDIAYTDRGLYAWSTDGSGVVALQGELATTVWSIGGQPIALARFDGGAVLATREGSLAYVDELGTVALAHRPVDIRVIATDPRASRVVVGMTTGELLVLDLSQVRPERLRVPATTTLEAIGRERMVIADTPGSDVPGATGSSTIALIDLASRTRTELGAARHSIWSWLAGSTLVVADGPVPQRLRAWNVAGPPGQAIELFRVDDIAESEVTDERGRRRVYYATTSGELLVTDLEPIGPPHTLGRYPPGEANGRRIPRIVGLDAQEDGVMVRLRDPADSTRQFVRFERDVGRELAVPLTGAVGTATLTRDGTWWLVEDLERLWRMPAGGAPARVSLDQPIKYVMGRGDHAWAFSAQTRLLHELALDGSVRRSIAIPGDKHQLWLEAVVVLQASAGLVVVTPAANVRFSLPVPRGTILTRAARDASVIAALAEIPGTSDRVIAWWRDPVPTDPRLLATYIESLTNARLELGSDAVTWD